ncbi:LCP family protein [Gracilibacillus sp. S3-1-1]|uniref:LCP family protein n=1 Tax=Gracilibacillus pellucidus TaxID=3095368 RepID=A0ACC6M873_9BACI|nr:LCP family protein [Gracilibacillus sp. S3-1-1]MDX8047144.1 LCP family protein [Gracilibacillus sp. S3-1-1]
MSSEMRRSKKKKPLWLKILLGVLIAIFVVLIGIAIYAYTVYDSAKKTVNDQMHNDVETIDRDLTKQKVSDQETLNILLIGNDQRPGERGRSDSLLVMTLNPKKEQMQILSIPRDTRTTIVGRGTEDKINHAYAFGGPDMSIATVENLLDIDIDYYVEINMEGMVQLIDEVGGITVQNDLDFTQNGMNYAKGELNLNGKETLGYVRMRKDDPRGDFGRTDRQRQVIEATIDKGANIASVTKLHNFIDILGENMQTNMDFEDMQNLIANYANVRKNTNEYMLQGSGKRINNTYYYIVPKEELAKVHNMIVDEAN